MFHATKYRTHGHHGLEGEIGCGPEFYGWLYDEEVERRRRLSPTSGSYGAATSSVASTGCLESVYSIRGNFTKDYDVPGRSRDLRCLKYPKASAIIEGTWATNGFDPRR